MKNVLLDKGIILPSGEISKDKVNLVAGAITQSFAEMVWVTTGGDMETVNRLTDAAVFYDGKRVLGGAFIASQRGHTPLKCCPVPCRLFQQA